MHEMTFIERMRNKKDREEGGRVEREGGKTKSEREMRKLQSWRRQRQQLLFHCME